MKQLASKLNSIPNSYFEFVDTTLDYANQKEEHLVLLLEFLNQNPSATPSDIIHFISLQPDFFDDCVPSELTTLVVS